MDRDQARQEVYARFRQELQPDKKGKGFICPVCGSGSGKNGTGITENPRYPNHFTCWRGCFNNADAFDILASVRGIPPRSGEAMKYAYERYGIEVEWKPDPFQRSSCQKKEAASSLYRQGIQDRAEGETEPVIETPQDYTSYYRQCMERLSDPCDPAGAMYLSQRGISPEVAREFQLGYDPAWRSPTAIRNGKNPPESPRLIIPTGSGSYVARDIRPTKSKYAKMKEGAAQLFNAQALYTKWDQAVFITEGEVDALSVIEVGGLAMALGSVSNVSKLIAKLEERPTRSTLILCLDNDEAGKKAAETLSDALDRLSVSYVCSDITLGKKDPNEALQSDREAFGAAVQAAEQKTSAQPDSVTDYIYQIMDNEMERFREGASRKTGYQNLDEAVHGIYPGLYVLGAISSLGKTTFIHQMADQMAALGEHILFFSLEQSRLEMVSKSLARITVEQGMQNAVTSLSIRSGVMTSSVQTAIQTYTRRVGNRMSIIEGNFNCNVAYISNYVQKYIRRNDVRPVVMVDYLQILQGDPAQRHTTRELVDTNVTELKRLSRNLDIPIFLISSLNRGNYLTPVDFESFKESGGIEYTADVIWGLQLTAIHDETFSTPQNVSEKRQKIREAKAETPRKIELVCLKNRYGISSYSVAFKYYPQYDMFVPDE